MRALVWWVVGACGLVMGCGSSKSAAESPSGGSPQQGAGAARGATAPLARAKLQTTQGYRTSGEVSFFVEDERIRVRGTVNGLTPNAEHGFHIHEFGDCSAADASSAGDHFSPHPMKHGHPGQGEHHLGDLFNLRADAAGTAQVDQVIEKARLGDGSSMDIVGRAVIVHVAPDDYETQPAGGSGARIACGVIESVTE